MITLERNYRSTQPILDLANAVLAGAGRRLCQAAVDRRARWCPARAGHLPGRGRPGGRGRRRDPGAPRGGRGVAPAGGAVPQRPPQRPARGRVAPPGDSRSSSTGVSGFWRPPTSATSWRRCGCSTIPATSWRGSACCSCWTGSVRPGPVGPSTALGVSDFGADPMARFVGPDPPLHRAPLQDAAPLRSALDDCRADTAVAGAQIDRLREGLDPLLRRRYDNAEVRIRDLDALSRLAGGYDSRARAVAELTLDPPVSTGDLAGPPLLDDDYVILSTVHSAKGGEWRVVHLIHAADGMFPSDLATGDLESAGGGAPPVLCRPHPGPRTCTSTPLCGITTAGLSVVDRTLSASAPASCPQRSTGCSSAGRCGPAGSTRLAGASRGPAYCCRGCPPRPLGERSGW